MRLIPGLLILLLAPSVSATTYYVDSSAADDTGNGSISQPWKTLDKVEAMMGTFTSDSATSDVTVYFNNARTWTMTDGNDRFAITCFGTASHWITFDGKSWGAGTRAKITRSAANANRPVIWSFGNGSNGSASLDLYFKLYGLEVDGNSITDQGIIQFIDASYVTVDDCVIHHTKVSSGWSPGVFFTTTTHANAITIHDLTITNNQIYNISVHGIAIYPSSGAPENDYSANLTISNNAIYNFGMSPDGHYGAGIQVMSCDTATISGNTIHDGYMSGTGYGINLTPRARVCNNVTIKQNLIYNVQQGMTNIGGTLVDVYSNIVYATASYGIFWDGQAGAGSGNIYNNTLYNIPDHALAIGTGATVSNLKNNLVYQPGVDKRCLLNNGTLTAHSNNLFYNPNAGSLVVNSFTTANWVASFEPSGISSNPLFTNAGTADFTLQATSPAINVGANLGSTYQTALLTGSTWPSGVLTGNQNSYGAGWETGAYIYGAQASPRTSATGKISIQGSGIIK